MLPKVLHCLTVLILLLVPLSVPPSCPAAPMVLAQNSASPAPSASAPDQPMAVPTGGSTFKKGLSYFLVAVLFAGALVSVCRSSNRS